MTTPLRMADVIRNLTRDGEYMLIGSEHTNREALNDLRRFARHQGVRFTSRLTHTLHGTPVRTLTLTEAS